MYKPKKLSNGLRYIIIPKESETVAVSVLIKTGSAYESKEQNGIAHFLEHMMFKATKKRTSAKEIAVDFEKVGALNNAFTSETTTGYWAKSAKAHASHILEILSDIYIHAQFPENEIEKEKGVVMQEMAMYEDMPQEKIGMAMSELMYAGQSFGRSILGTKETVSNLTQKQLIDFYHTYYGPKNTLIIVSGGIDVSRIEKEIIELFGNVTSPTKVTGKTLLEPKAVVRGKRSSFFTKKTDQVHLVLAAPAPGYTSADRFPVEVLTTILGRGMSSRLFQKMREELGICYYVYAGYSKLTDKAGQFYIPAGVDSTRSQIAVDGIWQECVRLKKELVPADELKKVKQMLKAGLAMSTETAEDIGTFYGSQYIRGNKALTLAQLYKKIDAVTSSQVKKVAERIFDKKHMFIGAIGESVDTLKIK